MIEMNPPLSPGYERRLFTYRETLPSYDTAYQYVHPEIQQREKEGWQVEFCSTATDGAYFYITYLLRRKIEPPE